MQCGFCNQALIVAKVPIVSCLNILKVHKVPKILTVRQKSDMTLTIKCHESGTILFLCVMRSAEGLKGSGGESPLETAKDGSNQKTTQLENGFDI